MRKQNSKMQSVLRKPGLKMRRVRRVRRVRIMIIEIKAQELTTSSVCLRSKILTLEPIITMKQITQYLKVRLSVQWR